ncbi:MAG: thiamine diphosphokinase [Nanoarchaeota archaeon]|nr:thiamine diphosphokinase [Nanoarchaeota archaeon]
MRAVIVCNGEIRSHSGLKELLKPDDFIIAADGGAMHLERLGLEPKAVIGDMDSIKDHHKEQFKEQLIVHEGQEHNDAEKALHLALKMGFDDIIFVGFEGSRLDHLLATVMLLKEYHDKELSLLTHDYKAKVIKNKIKLNAKKGDRVSLIPLTDSVKGITTKGLHHPLINAQLDSSTHGISNIASENKVSIKVDEGSLLLMHWF